MKNPFWTFKNPVIWVFLALFIVAIGLNRLFEWRGNDELKIIVPIAVVVLCVAWLWLVGYLSKNKGE
jgi:hypothetical protein